MVSRYYFLDNHWLPQLCFVGSHLSLLMTSVLPLHVQPHLNQALLCQGCSVKWFILLWQTWQKPLHTVIVSVCSHYLKSSVTRIKSALEFGTLNKFKVKFPRAASCFECAGDAWQRFAPPEAPQRAMALLCLCAEWKSFCECGLCTLV